MHAHKLYCRALKQSYISNGGYDSSILAQIAEMEMAVSELDRLNYSMHSIRENRGLLIFFILFWIVNKY